MRRMLAVLGHTNDKNGQLSPSAILRCKAAANYLGRNPVTCLVTTGAYGANFNPSRVPHGILMLDAIRSHGVSLENITVLGHTPTAFTEEDIFYVRKLFIDQSCDAITLVSSEFHIERVAEIAKLVFRDTQVDFQTAEDGPEIKDQERQKELAALSRFRDFWADVPLYKKDAVFPEMIYENAMEQHKHCDTISLALVTGALLIASYPHTKIDYATAGLESSVLLVICGFVGAGLHVIYLRFAAYAFTARRVMRTLELSWAKPGFSYNHDRYSRPWLRLRWFRTAFFLGLLIIAVVAINIALAVLLAF